MNAKLEQGRIQYGDLTAREQTLNDEYVSHKLHCLVDAANKAYGHGVARTNDYGFEIGQDMARQSEILTQVTAALQSLSREPRAANPEASSSLREPGHGGAAEPAARQSHTPPLVIQPRERGDARPIDILAEVERGTALPSEFEGAVLAAHHAAGMALEQDFRRASESYHAALAASEVMDTTPRTLAPLAVLCLD